MNFSELFHCIFTTKRFKFLVCIASNYLPSSNNASSQNLLVIFSNLSVIFVLAKITAFSQVWI